MRPARGAAQKAREFPATFVHGAKLSCNKCGVVLRENVDVIRRGNDCVKYKTAMSRVWRMRRSQSQKGHSSLKLRKARISLKQVTFLTNASIEVGQYVVRGEDMVGFANRKIIDGERLRSQIRSSRIIK